jgi:hypothetical protein
MRRLFSNAINGEDKPVMSGVKTVAFSRLEPPTTLAGQLIGTTTTRLNLPTGDPRFAHFPHQQNKPA